MWSNTHLLPKADARAGIEREEYKRVLREVLRNAVIEEAVGVKLVRCTFDCDKRSTFKTSLGHPPSGPQYSFLRCIANTVYVTLCDDISN